MSNDQTFESVACATIGETAQLPDVAVAALIGDDSRLDWVGMDAIDLPLRIVADGIASCNDDIRVPGRVSVEVDLRSDATRGIHMSRLYLALDKAVSEPLSPAVLKALLREMLDSHIGLSTCARVRMAFEYFLRRPALVSEHSGWRRYPVVITATIERDALTIDVQFDVVYSSTCPASTALARQLVAQDFAHAFPAHAPLDREKALQWLASEHGMRATPHSQRSTAQVAVRLDPTVAELPFAALIAHAESALGTAVQTTVKRIDEQAFARANGENQMFCEDAVRRLHLAFADSDPMRALGVHSVRVHVAHHESLHAHDAVASIGER